MKRLPPLLLFVSLLGCGSQSEPATSVVNDNAGNSPVVEAVPPTTDDNAPASSRTIAAIQALGGSFELDGQSPGRIVAVDFHDTDLTDDGLEYLKELRSLQTLSLDFTLVTDDGLRHLKGLTNLQGLVLGYTLVTDDGLVHLRELVSLQQLILDGALVTDDGLEHLAGLTNLQTLYLNGTQVTDAGLVCLSELTSLRRLGLRRTQVTESGVQELQAALPDCEILWMPVEREIQDE